MKTVFAVILAFAFLIIGWGMLATLLCGVLYVANNARAGMELLNIITILLMWILGPAFGGFLATNITSKIMKSVSATIITTSFISVVVTIATILALINFNQSSTGEFIMFVVQMTAIVIGAKIGDWLEKNKL